MDRKKLVMGLNNFPFWKLNEVALTHILAISLSNLKVSNSTTIGFHNLNSAKSAIKENKHLLGKEM